MHDAMISKVETFLNVNMKKHNRYVPARLQTALALLEKLRCTPSLDLDVHLVSKGSSGLESHETFGNIAHDKLNLERINKNHGRRSSSLQDWGQQLLNILRDEGFPAASTKDQSSLVDTVQKVIASHLRAIIEQEPLEVRVRGRSAESVIHEVLKLAEEKGKTGDVAQYLIGAKLALRFNSNMPVFPANKADRKSRSDSDARLGDFQLEDAVIEVAVGLPDEKHLTQIVEALGQSDLEVWLLTRPDRVATWMNELHRTEGLDVRRVIITSVEAFVGQNITELAKFSVDGKLSQLKALFDLYNSEWVSKVGTPGIRIAIK